MPPGHAKDDITRNEAHSQDTDYATPKETEAKVTVEALACHFKRIAVRLDALVLSHYVQLTVFHS
jgi:hypothetical protein